MLGLFLTGTDTGVGKTWVTAMVARDLQDGGTSVGTYKPVASGTVDGRWQDIDMLSKALGDQFPAERICPQRFDAPLAPPEAARRENREIDAGLLRSATRWWTDHVELLLVEGVGGLLCPLTETETIAELAVDLGWPVIIVARSGLGTINHTLLTIEAARHRSLVIAGVITNDACPADPLDRSVQTNAMLIERHGGVRVLGHVAHRESSDLLTLDAKATIDWLALAGQSS
ncbi:MAG: dethiobiotin synthase [Planctomycetaceae bacterium]|jgi:dethiobiotin synthetase|nr:dethiobiotin synthase [Planctomycetaceae bacterium]